MSDVDQQELGLTAKLVLVLAVGLIVAGLAFHGFTMAVFHRFWHDMFERPDGPMRFRFVLQPAMAVLAAIRHGVKDARAGRTPYFWTIASNRSERVARLREGLEATARIILLGVAMDVIYQLIVFKTFYPFEALVIALLLAFVPYLVMRGPVTRIARFWLNRASADKNR
jgi:hypothetical protein